MQTWLSNRIGVKLVAPDLSGDGFQLVGGRLPGARSSGVAERACEQLVAGMMS